jgi:hypothetical protein
MLYLGKKRSNYVIKKIDVFGIPFHFTALINFPDHVFKLLS